MAETAVEGIALGDLLAERGTLEPQETYLAVSYTHLTLPTSDLV